MRTHIASIFLLFIGGAAGCGAVDDGQCPTAEQSDDIACTLDICNSEAGGWAHVPDNSLCEAGQRCDPTGGCVAAGALTGRATLFGYTDHSGITVSIDGIEGASTTTAADGSWSLGALPTGTFTVSYSKAKFKTATESGVAVFPEAATSPPDVQLTHGNDLAPDQAIDWVYNGDYYNGHFVTPDKKHVMVRYNRYAEGTIYRAYRLDALQDAPVPIFEDRYNPYQPVVPVYLTNTHAVWVLEEQVAWSRPLDGGPPVIIGSVSPNERLHVVGNPGGPHIILQKARPATGFTEYSLYSVRVDGSAPMGTPFWVAPDAQHGLSFVMNNDTHAIIGLTNSSGTPPADAAATTPLRRVDLATGMVTPLNTSFATSSAGAYSMSPDRQWLYGNLFQNSTSWYRAFLVPISGTGNPVLAPDYGTQNGGSRYSDIQSGQQGVWLPDSSGIVFPTQNYPLLAGGSTEGQLKVWLVNQPQSTVLAAYGSYYNSYSVAGWQVYNKVVTYRDNANAYSPLRVVTAHSTSPVTYVLDASNVNLNDFAVNIESPTSTYLVWTESVGAGNGTRARIYSVNMSAPLLAAPSVVQLGGTLATTCNYEAVLSDTTYWQLCRDTGVLSGFLATTTNAGTQTTGVRAGLIALPEANRIGFRKLDGKLYSSPNTGTLSDVTLVSAMWEPQGRVAARGNWVVFNDVNGAYLRASNADGSAIDEPLTSMRTVTTPFANNPPQLFMDPDGTHLLYTYLRPGGDGYGEYVVPTANMP